MAAHQEPAGKNIYTRHKVQTKRRGNYLGTPIFLLIIFTFLLNFTKVPTQAQVIGHITQISNNPEDFLGDDESLEPSISSDGRFIAYLSQTNNLERDQPSKTRDLYLHDRLIGTTNRIAKGVDDGRLSSNSRFLTITTDVESPTTYLFDLLKNTPSWITNDSMFGIEPSGMIIEDLSSDGRYLVLISPKGKNTPPAFDGIDENLFIYDRLTEQLLEIPFGGLRVEFNPEFPSCTISGDGRIIAFHGKVIGHGEENESQRIIIYNRVLGELTTLNLPFPDNNDNQKISVLDLSESGDIIAVQYHQDRHDTGRVVILDLQEPTDQVILSLNLGSLGLSLSGNGEYLAVVHSSVSEGSVISRINLVTGEMTSIDQGVFGNTMDISNDGNNIVYTKALDNIPQVFLWEENPSSTPNYILSGRVTDPTGYPLALVSIKDDQGHKTISDHEGYFWLNGIPLNSINLIPSKEGFDFKPRNLYLDVVSDLHNLEYIYTHKESLKEAELDLGMPYSMHRGASGPFHGYSAGYCTDLILDAFSWGLDLNIQLALEMDYKAHPWHFYRWRNARDAHDMWRYFSYSGQIHPHEDPYLPGDIVFFDWDQDGEIDHVSLVSRVDSRNRPEMIYDATGVINSNPGGLASELEWEIFHEERVRGFARWSGLYEPIILETPQVEVFQFVVLGDGIMVRLIDENGSAISPTENEILDGRYENLFYEQSISILEPISNSRFYLLVIANLTDQQIPYTFTGQFVINGLVANRIEYSGEISGDEIATIRILREIDDYGDASIVSLNPVRRIEGNLP